MVGVEGEFSDQLCLWPSRTTVKPKLNKGNQVPTDKDDEKSWAKRALNLEVPHKGKGGYSSEPSNNKGKGRVMNAFQHVTSAMNLEFPNKGKGGYSLGSLIRSKSIASYDFRIIYL